MNFNIRNGSKLRYTIPVGDVGDNFLVVDPVTFEISFRTPAQVGALATGGSNGDVLYNNAGVIGGFGDWNGSRLEIGGNFKLGEAAQSGSARTITADGSATDVGITITPKGAGAVVAGSATVNVGNSGDTLIDNVSSSTNSALTVRSKGTGSAVLRSPSGNVVLSAGNSSEVVLGESTTSASTRIISVAGTPSNIDLVLEPKGTGTVVSEANLTLGSTSLSGSSRTIQSGGSASDVSLVLASKGNGSVSLISTSPDYGSGANVVFIPNTVTPTTSSPTGGGTLYSSSKELIWFGSKSFNLVNQFVGKNINSVVANPTITEDGQGLIWDNTAGQYTLGTLVASAGGTNTQIQYNNSGNLGGFGSWDGSTMTVPGSFQIGDTGTAGTNRNITAEGSVGNVSITLDPKGTANVILAVDGGQVNIGSGSGTTRIIQSVGSSTDVSLVLSPQGAGSIYTNSNFYIGSTSLSGSDRILAPEGSGSNINLQVVPKGTGNLSLFSTTPTYGGGTGVVYIKSATGAPTGSITGGGALYVTPTAIRFVNSSGTDYDLTQTAQVAVRKNSTGGDIGLRRRINFIEGTNITMTITDDVGNDEIDVTINSSGGGGGYTDEQAQDAVGSILTDTSSINFTYDDATPTITADVIADSSVQRIAVRKNSTGGDVGTRRRLNFIEGSNVTITTLDDSLNNELDITIAASGGAGDVVGPASATDNAIARFDGTTGKLIQNSVAILDDSANLTLGSIGLAGSRTISAVSSDTNASLSLTSQGSGGLISLNNYLTVGTSTATPQSVTIGNGTTGRIFYSGSGVLSVTTQGSGMSIATSDRTTNGVSGNVSISSGGGGIAANGSSGHILIQAGGKTGTGTEGNLSIHSASVPSFQAMEKGIYIANAVTLPTGNPTGGGFLYVNAGALTYRGSSGTITVIAPA